ncbi:MAG: Apolipoprotein N-acyltransferase [Chlamydiia bacterium]|nr:Apolipoprotein N-acyltransferase [Chlamydiia bacterium]
MFKEELLSSGKKRVAVFAILWLLSFFIVAFGQPAWSLKISVVSAFIGHSIFWAALYSIKGRKQKFLHGFVWFACVEAVHLSWMTATRFHGAYILCVYFGVLIWLGAQYGLFCVLLRKKSSISHCLFLAGMWTLFEYSRLFFFCGFAFNPVGLALSSYSELSTFASVFGVYGLSFLVILLNAFAYRAFTEASKGNFAVYFGSILLLFTLGVAHNSFHKAKAQSGDKKQINVALVQTGLRPDQKIMLSSREHHFISPYDQWLGVLTYIKQKKSKDKNLDLIVFPEAAIPFGAKQYPYSYRDACYILDMVWGQEYRNHIPELKEPFAKQRDGDWYISNSFFAQSLSNFYSSEVLIGLDDFDREKQHIYNAAFHFVPRATEKIKRYEKRKLVPLGEYLPVKSLENLVAKYGITGFSEHGKSAKVFGEKVRISPSICYEECFSHLMRDGKKLGAEVFVNLTNDAWYYPSKLPEQHFYHARLRAIENGVPLLRSCNTGITAAVDSLGKTKAMLSSTIYDYQNLRGALVFSLDLYHYFTIYTLLGDYLILAFSFAAVGFFAFRMKRNAFLSYIPYR